MTGDQALSDYEGQTLNNISKSKLPKEKIVSKIGRILINLIKVAVIIAYFIIKQMIKTNQSTIVKDCWHVSLRVKL
jgi:hypothetical protein